jgi:hypothetical protein
VPLVRRAAAIVCTAVFVGTLLGGCSGGNSSKAAPATTAPAVPLPDPQPTPRPHLADAVRDLLDAEQHGDSSASFLLLSRQSRGEYKDVADWTKRRQQLPAVTGFRIDPADGGDRADRAGKAVAVVEHLPALDPFKGLSLARENQSFTGRREGAGWLVDGDPDVEPLLPPEPRAVEAATAWVAAVQSCDQAKAAGLQAVPTIFGSAEGANGLCGKQGPVTPGPVDRLTPGVASADIVAQYSTDALEWARVVRITSPAAFGVVLAPIGDRWQVLGLAD